MNDEEFRAAVKAKVDNKEISVAEIARRAEVSYDIVRDLLRRENATTSFGNAIKIANAIELKDPLIVRVETSESQPAESSLVPVYDVAASAGFGAFVEYEAEAHGLAFPPDYLRRLTSASPSSLSIISVKGDSMEPTLLDDDIVLLDASKRNLSFDGLFVLRFDDALHVKRVGRSAVKGSVTIISDNPLFPPNQMRMEEIDPVGKVLWYGRRV